MSTIDAMRSYVNAQLSAVKQTKDAQAKYTSAILQLGGSNANRIDSSKGSAMNAAGDESSTQAAKSAQLLSMELGIANALGALVGSIAQGPTQAGVSTGQNIASALVTAFQNVSGILANNQAQQQVFAKQLLKDRTLLDAANKSGGAVQGI